MILKRILKYSHWQLGRFVQFIDRDEKKYHEESIKFQEIMVANNEEVYDQMYADPKMLRHYLVESRIDFYRQVAKKVDAYFKGDKANSSCLDVGCGTGHLLAELRRAGFSGRLVGIDVAASAEHQVRSHNLNLEFYPGYLSSHSWGRQFDLILCTEVLEHCDYPNEVVLGLFSVIKPGGVVMISVPDGRKDTWEGHVHFWSPESFKLFIGNFGKKVIFDYFENTNFCVIFCEQMQD